MPMLKSRFRWFMFLTALIVVALLRAERGVAEMEGAPRQPSRILRVTPQPGGDWTVTAIGIDRRIPVQRLISAVRGEAERIVKALP